MPVQTAGSLQQQVERCHLADHQVEVEIKALLEEAGFSDTRVETLDLDPPVVCVLGANEERIA